MESQASSEAASQERTKNSMDGGQPLVVTKTSYPKYQRDRSLSETEQPGAISQSREEFVSNNEVTLLNVALTDGTEPQVPIQISTTPEVVKPKAEIDQLRTAFSNKMLEYEKRIADAREIRKNHVALKKTEAVTEIKVPNVTRPGSLNPAVFVPIGSSEIA